MKKQLLFVAAALSFSAVSAQAPLTKVIAPMPNDVIYTVTDLAPNNDSVSVGAAGNGKTWDFTKLAGTRKDTANYVDPTTTPYATDFPTATVASKTRSGSNFRYTFYQASNKNYVTVGSGRIQGGQPVATKLNPPQEIIRFNVALTKSYNDTIATKNTFYIGGQAGSPYDSVRLTTKTIITYKFDGFGTLKTPLASVSNTWRVKVDGVTRQTTEGCKTAPVVGCQYSTVKDTTTKTHRFTWYANSIKGAVLQATLDTSGTKITRATYTAKKDSVAASSINDDPAVKSFVKVYPNPATDEVNITFTLDNVANIELLDITGKKVSTVAVYNNSAKINTTNYTAGFYLYRLVDSHDTMIHAGSFNVAK